MYGGERDISLFRHLNKELINNIIDVTVDVFKLSITDVQESLYDEAINKVYKQPVRIPCLIGRDDQQWNSDDFGSDVNQSMTFAFLRDTLKDDADIVMEIGDIIKWNENFWEVGGIIENQFVVGKNPDTDHVGGTFGGNHSIICSAHLTRRSNLSIERTNTGNPDNLYYS